MTSWGEDWEEKTWLQRLFVMVDHPLTSITADQRTQILEALLIVPQENRETAIGEIMKTVILSKYN